MIEPAFWFLIKTKINRSSKQPVYRFIYIYKVIGHCLDAQAKPPAYFSTVNLHTCKESSLGWAVSTKVLVIVSCNCKHYQIIKIFRDISCLSRADHTLFKCNSSVASEYETVGVNHWLIQSSGLSSFSGQKSP